MGLGLIRLGLGLVPLGLVFGVCWLGLCFGLLRFVPLLNFGLYICVRLVLLLLGFGLVLCCLIWAG